MRYNTIMKLNLKKNDIKKLKQIIETKEINISIADMFFYLFDRVDIFNEFNVKQLMIKNNLSVEEALLTLAIDNWEIDTNNNENKKIINDYIKGQFIELDYQKIIQNPYYKSIKLDEINLKNVKIENLSFKPYEIVPVDEITVEEDNYFKEKTKLGYFKKELPYIAISKNKTIWMSITPSEIDSMENEIKEASGKVITFGLGLGYYAYMVSLKDDVSEVKIVEKDKEIINLFLNYILPQFPYKNKIEIIEDDAFNYLDKNRMDSDYAYFDLWHSPNDGLPMYLKIKEYENNYSKTKFTYWLKESILALYRRMKITLLEEALMGYKDKNYLKAKTEEDRLINELYFKTKNIPINTIEDVIAFLK